MLLPLIRKLSAIKAGKTQLLNHNELALAATEAGKIQFAGYPSEIKLSGGFYSEISEMVNEFKGKLRFHLQLMYEVLLPAISK